MNCQEMLTIRSKRFPYNLTSSGLAKMLMFGDYVKSKAVMLSKTQQEVMEEELNNYPYNRKDENIDETRSSQEGGRGRGPD